MHIRFFVMLSHVVCVTTIKVKEQNCHHKSPSATLLQPQLPPAPPASLATTDRSWRLRWYQARPLRCLSAPLSLLPGPLWLPQHQVLGGRGSATVIFNVTVPGRKLIWSLCLSWEERVEPSLSPQGFHLSRLSWGASPASI